MFTEAILCTAFTSYMSFAAACPWLALQSIALRSLEALPAEGLFDPAPRGQSALEAGSDAGAPRREPEGRKAA